MKLCWFRAHLQFEPEKVRYFEDRRLAERVLPPPRCAAAASKSYGGEVRTRDDWSALPIAGRPPNDGAEVGAKGDHANGGIRREPTLPDYEAMVAENPRPAEEFAIVEDDGDAIASACGCNSSPRPKRSRGRRPWIQMMAWHYEGIAMRLRTNVYFPPEVPPAIN